MLAKIIKFPTSPSQKVDNLMKIIHHLPGKVYLGNPSTSSDIRANKLTKLKAKKKLHSIIEAHFYKKYPLT